MRLVQYLKIDHVNRLKKKNHIIIIFDPDKVFEKIVLIQSTRKMNADMLLSVAPSSM